MSHHGAVMCHPEAGTKLVYELRLPRLFEFAERQIADVSASCSTFIHDVLSSHLSSAWVLKYARQLYTITQRSVQ